MTGAHVVITGATGFVGKVVLEQLLRRRTELGVAGVTMIVRTGAHADRGAAAALRCARVLAAPLFAAVPADALAQVEVVAGDLERPGCGLADADRAALVARATHVIHCAASVEFDLPVATAASANIATALEVLELARACARLRGMVDVSTAYVAPWRPGPIEERLAHLPRDAEQLYAAIRSGARPEAELLAETGHPNTYTLTKCIAEHLIARRRGDVPVAIVRPSIVSASWRAPFPGWIDSTAALAGCLLYVGLGMVRAWCADPGVRLDVVPVDAVATAILDAAFGPMPAPGAALPIHHATMGVARALRIDRAVGDTVEFFRERPGVARVPGMFVGRDEHGFARADLVRRELPVLATRAWLAATNRRRDRRRLEKADARARYLNAAFAYFTHHTFDFRAVHPLALPGFDPVAYVDVVNRGLYRHLLRRDETQLPFAGAAHDDARGDLRWLGERPAGGATLRALGVGLRKAMRACADSITFDRPSFERAVAAAPAGALFVLAPSHRSYLDFLLASYLTFQHPELGIPLPAIAAAEEFGRIPVVGDILKASGAFYLKRGAGRAAPELNDELRRLADRGASLMMFVEGQRSRARRFLPARRGLLRGLQATGRTFAILPIAISYDRLPEERALAIELCGGARPKMSLGGLAGWIAELARGRVQLGRIHLACGAPLVLDGEADVPALARAIVAEHQRHTAVSRFHLRAFLSGPELASAGVTEAWLAGAIERRGGRVLDSELPVPSPLGSALASSLRNQWQHWFYGDALARHPDSMPVRDHIARNAWCPTPRAADHDPRTHAVVDALVAPIERDYREVFGRLSALRGAELRVGPVDLARAVPAAHAPNLDDAYRALADLGVLRAGGAGYAWGPRADDLHGLLAPPAAIRRLA